MQLTRLRFLALVASSFVILTCFSIQAPVFSMQDPDVIDIWISGSPHDDDGNGLPSIELDDSITTALSELNLIARVQGFSANQFPIAFADAVENGTIPEIISSGNFLPLSAIRDANAEILDQFQLVIESLRAISAFTYLMKNSDNYEAAKRLALRTPQCQNEPVERLIGISERGPFQALATTASLEYLIGDFETFSMLLSENSIQRDTRFDEIGEPEAVVFCAWHGNSQLLFASTITSFQTSSFLGYNPLIIVMQHQNDTWKVLSATADALALSEHDEFVEALFDQLNMGDSAAPLSEPASIISPDNGLFPEPAEEARFGEFVFSPSPSPNVIFEIAEFDYGSRTRLFFFDRGPLGTRPDEEIISTGRLITANTNWNWRIWSITAQGLISFSKTRSFDH